MSADTALSLPFKASFVPTAKGGKKPAFAWKGKGVASADRATLESWLAQYDLAYCLPETEALIVDLDPRNADCSPAADAIVKLMRSSLKFVCSTPSGGIHAVLKPKHIKPRKPNAGFAKLWAEVKSAKSICNAYEPDGSVPGSLEECPEWLADWLSGTSVPSEAAAELVKSHAITSEKGSRNDTLFKGVCILIERGVPYELIKKHAHALSSLEEAEVEATLESARSKVAAPTSTKSAAEAALADFAARGEDIAYSPSPGKETAGIERGFSWVRFEPELGWMKQNAMEVKASFRASLKLSGTADAYSNRTVSSAMHTAAVDKYVAPELWDVDLDLVAASDGRLLSLKTRALVKPRPSLYISKKLGAVPGGEAKVWREKLKEWTDGSSEIEAMLRQLAGYSLLSSNPSHIFAFFWGLGGNGKSTYLDALCEALGDYALNNFGCGPLLESGRHKHLAELAHIDGFRLAVVEDMPPTGWDVSRIKQLAGGSSTTVRGIAEEPRSMRTTCLLIGQGNELPRVKGGESWRRRVIVCPWPSRPKNPDRMLSEKLKLELGGILSWMLDGLDEVRANRWRVDVAADAAALADVGATASSEPLDEFASDCLSYDAKSTAAIADIAKAYDMWSRAHDHEDAWSRTTPQRMLQLLTGPTSPGIACPEGIRPIKVGKVRKRISALSIKLAMPKEELSLPDSPTPRL